MKKPAQNVTLRAVEGEALIARVHQSNVRADDAGVVEQVSRMYFWVAFALQEAQLSVKRLRDVLFGPSRKPKTPPESEASSTSSEPLGQAEGGGEPAPVAEASPSVEAAGCAAGPAPSEGEAAPKPQGGHRQGTGRLGADAYVGAQRTECRPAELAVGQHCPVCGPGTVDALPPGVEIRIDGHGVLSAMRYALQKLRCAACGQIFTASLPTEAGEDQDSPRARAVVALGRYSLGLPCYRLQSYQAILGVPVADATPWDHIEQVGDCRDRVCEVLERLAAQGELIHQDDTSVRILSLMDENLTMRAQAEARGLSRPTERTGMFTTAWVVQVGARTICLYYSGRAHAGETRKALLEQRQADLDKPFVMSDALSRNEAEEAGLSRCHCLAHGRRQFSDLADVCPKECQVVIEALKQGFDHDDEARDQQMSPAKRLTYHQAPRQPLMGELKRWLQKQLDDQLVEPNSALGQAICYMQGHGETLTRFVSIVGAPVDNTLGERALTLFMRQRKNSRFLVPEHSADIARVLTSLIATCLHAGVHVLESLVALQAHRAEVFAEPAAWLPWTYQARLAPPEATRRQSAAMWARSGSPFHSTMLSSRADRGTRVSAV